MATEHDSVDLVDGAVTLSFVRAALLAALLGASAYVSIPIPLSPVPLTLQVFVVLLAGLTLGPFWSAFSVSLYLLAGALGAPVFAGGTAGLGVLVGETAGYLWAYLLAAPLIGVVVRRYGAPRDPAALSLPVLVAALLAALALVYGLGVGWLAWVLALDLREAVVLGAVYYVPGDLLKVAAAVAVVRSGAIPTGR